MIILEVDKKEALRSGMAEAAKDVVVELKKFAVLPSWAQEILSVDINAALQNGVDDVHGPKKGVAA